MVETTKNQLQFDSTKLRTALHCPRLSYWKFQRNIVPVEPRLPLIYGIAIHHMLAEWYRNFNLNSAILAFEDSWLSQGGGDGDDKRNPLRAVELMKNYRNYYSSEPFEVLDVEVVGAIPTGSFILVTIIDLVCKVPNYGIMPYDHKTTSYLDDNWWNSMNPNHQYSAYLFATRQLFGKNCNSLAVNGILVHKTKTLFERQLTSRSDKELSQWLSDINFFVDNVLKVYIRENHWPQNDDYCTRWGLCEYHQLCTTVGVDYRQLEPSKHSFKEEIWDPLKIER